MSEQVVKVWRCSGCGAVAPLQGSMEMECIGLHERHDPRVMDLETLLPLDLITPLVEAAEVARDDFAERDLKQSDGYIVLNFALAALPELKAQEGEFDEAE